jgi:hydrogenase maturation protease
MNEKADVPITIVGAGNWLISCDRVGPKVLALCADRFGDGVELFDSGSAGLALLDCIRGQELMLVVDACKWGGRRGEIRVMDVDRATDPSSGFSVHQLGPLETLAVVRHLSPEKLPRNMKLIAVETEGLNEAELEFVCGQVLAVLDKEIACWRDRHVLHTPTPEQDYPYRRQQEDAQ